MSKSILARVEELLTPEVVQKAALIAGESAESTKSALAAVVPSVIEGFADQASTENGATDLFSHLNALPAIAGNDVSGWIQAGQSILASIFGGHRDGLLDVVANFSNIPSAAAGSLAALAAALVAKTVTEHSGGNPLALAEMLGHQWPSITAAAPAGMTSVIEDGGLSFRHLVPMALSALILLATPFLYRGCSEPVQAARVEAPKPPEPKREKIELPGGTAINVIVGTINHELALFLASDAPVPKTIVFDHLNFESGKTVITPESRPTLNDLITILKAYPKVDVRLEGRTDNVGKPEDNKKLSDERAAAIKTELLKDGIAAKRMTTAGFGEERPMAPNETDEGRARNRRLELVVVKK